MEKGISKSRLSSSPLLSQFPVRFRDPITHSSTTFQRLGVSESAVDFVFSRVHPFYSSLAIGWRPRIERGRKEVCLEIERNTHRYIPKTEVDLRPELFKMRSCSPGQRSDIHISRHYCIEDGQNLYDRVIPSVILRISKNCGILCLVKLGSWRLEETDMQIGGAATRRQ